MRLHYGKSSIRFRGAGVGNVTDKLKSAVKKVACLKCGYETRHRVFVRLGRCPHCGYQGSVIDKQDSLTITIPRGELSLLLQMAAQYEHCHGAPDGGMFEHIYRHLCEQDWRLSMVVPNTLDAAKAAATLSGSPVALGDRVVYPESIH